MSAASQARRIRDDLEIVALERGDWVSYAACGIPYYVAGEVAELDDLVARSPAEFRDRFRIDVRMRNEAMAIDLDRREVEIRDSGHDRTYRLGFDKLMVGTGGRPIRPDLPGIDLDFIEGVQTLNDADRLFKLANARDCRHVVVVGGGYIGLEMAEAFTQWGADVTVIDQARQPMTTLDEDMGELVAEAMKRHDIELMTETQVQGFEPGTVLLESGQVKADLVVLGIGVRPNSELAAEAGIATGVRDAITVDRRQRTSAAGVFAGGDCCESINRVSGRPVYVALGSVANRHGRVAGLNIAGGYAHFPGVLGTAVTRLCSTEVARTGLTESEADAAGFECVSATIKARTQAHYLPSSSPIAVKMVAESGTNRVVGAQIVGEQGAAKRIDIVATAITAGFTAHEMIDMDLSYAPPFSPVWDPVAVAARRAAAVLDANR